MRNRTSPSEYLALLSMKYNVDVDRFFNALVTASNNRKSTCGDLSIECRNRNKDKTVFLITKGPKVVAQLPVSEDFLLEHNNPIKSAWKTNALVRQRTQKYMKSAYLQIKDLRVGMKKVNVKAEVLEITNPLPVVTKFGSYASVANALISDETGTIKLCLWNDQITSLSAGDTVHIENARISSFRGERQLRIGKNGVLRIAPGVVAN